MRQPWINKVFFFRWMGTRRKDLRNRLASNDELHNTYYEHLNFFKFLRLICSIYLSIS